MIEARRKLLDVLQQLSEVCPELRLGQLVTNLATASRGAFPGTVWNAEDEELLPVAHKLLEYFRTTRSERAAEPLAAATVE